MNGDAIHKKRQKALNFFFMLYRWEQSFFCQRVATPTNFMERCQENFGKTRLNRVWDLKAQKVDFKFLPNRVCIFSYIM